MQAGEILRRAAFNGLDRLHGGKLAKIKAVNKREIVEGITEEYAQRLSLIHISEPTRLL